MSSCSKSVRNLPKKMFCKRLILSHPAVMPGVLKENSAKGKNLLGISYKSNGECPPTRGHPNTPSSAAQDWCPVRSAGSLVELSTHSSTLKHQMKTHEQTHEKSHSEKNTPFSDIKRRSVGFQPYYLKLLEYGLFVACGHVGVVS